MATLVTVILFILQMFCISSTTSSMATLITVILLLLQMFGTTENLTAHLLHPSSYIISVVGDPVLGHTSVVVVRSHYTGSSGGGGGDDVVKLPHEDLMSGGNNGWMMIPT